MNSASPVVKSMSKLDSKGRRIVLPVHAAECPVAIEIGLQQLSHLEVQKHALEKHKLEKHKLEKHSLEKHSITYWYAYWDKTGRLIQSRQLSSDEIKLIPEADEHVAKVFSEILRGMQWSDGLLERTVQDCQRVISELQRTTQELERVERMIPPVRLSMRVRNLRWLEARLWDFIELAELGQAISYETKELFPRPKAK